MVRKSKQEKLSKKERKKKEFTPEKDIKMLKEYQKKAASMSKNPNDAMMIKNDDLKTMKLLNEDSIEASASGILDLCLDIDKHSEEWEIIQKDLKTYEKRLNENLVIQEIDILNNEIQKVNDTLEKISELTILKLYKKCSLNYLDGCIKEFSEWIPGASNDKDEIKNGSLEIYYEIKKVQNKLEMMKKLFENSVINIILQDEKIGYDHEVLKSILSYENKKIIDLISKGEGQKIEFKSSLKYDCKKNKENKDLIYPIIEVAAGMLNTEGGNILIGVDDSGKILGLQEDLDIFNNKSKDKDNYDEFERHLYDKLKKNIKPLNPEDIKIDFSIIENKAICNLKIIKRKEPVYFNNKLIIKEKSSKKELKGEELSHYFLKRNA